MHAWFQLSNMRGRAVGTSVIKRSPTGGHARSGGMKIRHTFQPTGKWKEMRLPCIRSLGSLRSLRSWSNVRLDYQIEGVTRTAFLRHHPLSVPPYVQGVRHLSTLLDKHRPFVPIWAWVVRVRHPRPPSSPVVIIFKVTAPFWNDIHMGHCVLKDLRMAGLSQIS